MRTGARVSPSWPGGGTFEAGYVEADRSAAKLDKSPCRRGGPYVFKRELLAIEKAPKHEGRETLPATGDQAFLHFQQRHVRPAANETEQIVAMGLYPTGTTISPRRSRRDLALDFEACHPAHGAGDADPKTLGRRVARHAAFHHRPHNAFAKIVGERHPRRLLRTATIFKQIKPHSAIPPTIQFPRRPL